MTQWNSHKWQFIGGEETERRARAIATTEVGGDLVDKILAQQLGR